MRIAFLFPGQGVQCPGMLCDIMKESPAAASAFAEADAALGFPLSALIQNGPQETLNLTENTQPALLCAEIAALRALTEAGIAPAVCAGFSLGEWAALVCAGALEYSTALRLVRLRGQLMQSAVPAGEGAMAAVMGKSEEEVKALCDRAGGVAPSNYNCPGQITVSGRAAGVDALMAIAEAEGVAITRLQVSIPSHCSLMQPAAAALGEALSKAEIRRASVPVFMNATGLAVTEPAEIRENLVRQLTQPVRFEQSLRAMLSLGVDAFAEVGPGKVLTGFAKRTAKAAGAAAALYRAADLNTLAEAKKGLGV